MKTRARINSSGLLVLTAALAMLRAIAGRNVGGQVIQTSAKIENMLSRLETNTDRFNSKR